MKSAIEFNLDFIADWNTAKLGNRPPTAEPTPAPAPAGARRKNTEAESNRAKKNFGMLQKFVKTMAPAGKGLKGLESEYTIEAMDPRHRMADLLNIMYEKVYKHIMPEE